MSSLKRIIALTLISMLTFSTICPISLAEPGSDFGLSFLELYGANLAQCNSDDCKMDIGTLVNDFDRNTIGCSFVNELMGEYVIRPSSGDISSFRLTCPQGRINSLANDYGYIIGHIGMLLIKDGESLTTAVDRLGLSDDDIYTKDSYSSEVRLNGIYYKFDIKDATVTFEMGVVAEEVNEYDVRIDDAERIMTRIMSQSGIVDFTAFQFNADNDVNKLFGTEGSYSSKINFALESVTGDRIEPNPNISVQQGGAIEVFSSKHDAEARRRKLFQNAYLMPEYSELILCRDNIVLRLSPEISDDLIGQIAAAFYSTDFSGE